MDRVLHANAAAGQVVADEGVDARLGVRPGRDDHLVEDDEVRRRVEQRHRPRIGSGLEATRRARTRQPGVRKSLVAVSVAASIVAIAGRCSWTAV